MTAESLPFVPPAPMVHATDLSVWRLLWKITRSTLSIWPDHAFDKPYIRSRVLGVETIAISDPEGVRHVLTANAGNYRRPYSVTRISRPLAVQGFFSRKAPIGVASAVCWRQHSRLPLLDCCCHIFVTRAFTCCVRLKCRREQISRKPFRIRLWRRCCVRCFPCRKAVTANNCAIWSATISKDPDGRP